MRKILLTIALSFLLLSGLIVTAKNYTVYQMNTAPELSGKMDDPVWQLLPKGHGFFNLKGAYSLKRQNFFKIGWHKDKIYFGIYCEEPSPEKISAMKSYRDGLVSDESIEFFIMKPRGKFLQMIANIKGAYWCRWEDARKQACASPDWKIATHVGNKSWTLEMSIPFSMFDKKHELKSKYFFNVCRTSTQAPACEKYTCWAPAKCGFADKANFDTINFSRFAGPADIELKNNEINVVYNKFLFRLLHRIALKQKEYLKLKIRYASSLLWSQVDKLQQKIAQTYRKISKREMLGLYRQWVELSNKIAIKRHSIEFIVKKHDVKDFRLFLNGKEIEPNNAIYKTAIKEGLSSITASALALGDNPGVQVQIKGLPETAMRWRISNVAKSNWQKVKFNDNKWALAKKDASGYIWSKSGKQKLFMRQTLIWNEQYDGIYRCLNPPVRIWGFSYNSTEIMYLSLYSPVGRKINDYNFYFEVPEGIKLLDMNTPRPKHKTNVVPEEISSKKITREGKNYIQYKLSYPSSMIHEWQSYDSLLPLFNKTWKTTGQHGTFRYFRQLNGNITEIPGEVPFEILPPINGKMPKKIKLSFYQGSFIQPLSDEVRKNVINEISKTGFNYWIVYPWNSNQEIHKNLIRKNNGRMCVGFLNYPIWGAMKETKLAKLLKSIPELQAKYFKNMPMKEARKLGKYHIGKLPRYCESMALGKYRKIFVDTVSDDFKNIMFGPTPDAEATFLNYEYYAWVNEDGYRRAKRGEGATCFCKTCRENFRKYANIPKDKPLSDDDIFNNYYYEWEKFCYHQHSKIHKLVYDIIKGLGKTAIFYSGTHQYAYWETAGKIHPEIFIGSPGNSEINSGKQRTIDKHRKYFIKTCGNIPTTGQRFVMFRNTYSYNFTKHDGWRKFKVMSDNGILDQKSWKRQALRMCATYGAGFDLQNPLEVVSGIKYYIGEASRLIADYEDIFWANNRNDNLVESQDIAYPNALVLTKGNKRIVLLFNESNKDKTVTIRNKKLKSGQSAFLYYQKKKIVNPKQMTVKIPANDVTAIIIKK